MDEDPILIYHDYSEYSYRAQLDKWEREAVSQMEETREHRRIEDAYQEFLALAHEGEPSRPKPLFSQVRYDSFWRAVHCLDNLARENGDIIQVELTPDRFHGCIRYHTDLIQHTVDYLDPTRFIWGSLFCYFTGMEISICQPERFVITLSDDFYVQEGHGEEAWFPPGDTAE